jgi:hypothetical protein
MEMHTTHGASGSEPALTAWTDEEHITSPKAQATTLRIVRN